MNGIDIDYALESLVPESAMHLKDFYLREGETFQDGFARAAWAYSDDVDMANEIYLDVAKRKWAMFASPILSNAPLDGEHPRSQPISCFLGYVPDTRKGLVQHQDELAFLSMSGGGVGGHLSSVRSVGEKSVGVIPHLRVSDAAVSAYRQGKTRKGSYAAYLDISHPDILEFIAARSPTGGDIRRKCFEVNLAVNLTDKFMEAVLAGNDWDLVCPHTGNVVDTVDARQLFDMVIDTRFRTGEPYITFIDTANRWMPAVQKALGLRINGSNLCNEIYLATNKDRTAVCCLSSFNLAKFDEFKNDPNFVYRWAKFLDNVLQSFIDTASDEVAKAKYSAMRERSIGLGTMGLHTYFQERLIDVDSYEAQLHNKMIYKHLYEKGTQANKALGQERGEAPDMEGTGLRFAHVFAIAPNANSALLMGVSPSIEMYRSNAHTNMNRGGKALFVNDLLVEHIKEHTPGENMLIGLGKSAEGWLQGQIDRLILNKGSCQDFPYLSDEVKAAFKTAFEAKQRSVIKLAADRQPYICQGQSVNLYYPYGTDRNVVLKDHIMAWKWGLKGLYYMRSEAGFTGDKISEQVQTDKLKDYEQEDDECTACHA